MMVLAHRILSKDRHVSFRFLQELFCSNLSKLLPLFIDKYYIAKRRSN